MKKVLIEGVEVSVKDIVKKAGVCSASAYRRLNKYKTLKELFKPAETSGGGRRAKVFEIEGKTFDAITYSKKHPMSRQRAYEILNTSKTLEQLKYKTECQVNGPREDDLTQGGTIKVYEIEGRQFTAKMLAAETGISLTACYHRLKTSKTLEQLYQHKKTNQYGSMAKDYVVDGQTFTIREVADKMGISESTARYRLCRSKTVEELFAPVKQTGNRTAGETAVYFDERPVKMTEDAMFKLIMKAVA